MSVYVALLRGINVSGQKPMPMADLKKVCEKLGFKSVTTYIQSGNVVFQAPSQNEAALAASLEEAIQKKFAYHVPVIIRTVAAVDKILGASPYRQRKPHDLERGYITLLAAAPSAEALAKLAAVPKGPDDFHISGTEIYLWCRTGYGKTSLSIAFFEKILGVKATTRNLETLAKLTELGRSV